MRLNPGLLSHLAFNKTHRLIMALAVILLMGFLAVNILSFQVSRKAVREALVEHELPLTSDNIYSEIQASLLRPIHISSLMAHDTFLKDWMMAGEAEPEKVVRYLREIQTKYDVFSTFVVSALTDRYYHFNGILKTVSRDSAKDQWFFTMAQHPRGYRVDLDTNEAADDRLTIFVNHKIHDEPESTTLATVRQALIVSLAIGGAITLIVLSISGYTVHRFQTRLERMASIDPLSGLLNRQFAERRRAGEAPDRRVPHHPPRRWAP